MEDKGEIREMKFYRGGEENNGFNEATLFANKALYNKPYLTDDTDDRSFGAPGCVVLLRIKNVLPGLNH